MRAWGATDAAIVRGEAARFALAALHLPHSSRGSSTRTEIAERLAALWLKSAWPALNALGRARRVLPLALAALIAAARAGNSREPTSCRRRMRINPLPHQVTRALQASESVLSLAGIALCVRNNCGRPRQSSIRSKHAASKAIAQHLKRMIDLPNRREQFGARR